MSTFTVFNGSQYYDHVFFHYFSLTVSDNEFFISPLRGLSVFLAFLAHKSDGISLACVVFGVTASCLLLNFTDALLQNQFSYLMHTWSRLHIMFVPSFLSH